MNEAIPPTAVPPRKRFSGVLLEAAMVALFGGALAIATNAISPRGLTLTRNYFPGDKGVATAPVTVSDGQPASTSTTSANERLAARLQSRGLKLATLEEVKQLFHDPRYGQGLIVFVDARDDQHYQAGHIPGAHQFDHYRAPNYIPTVLPACQTAQQIVVYCKGGDCEDSEFTAITLRDLGISQEKLFVFGGGITEWTSNRLPVEVGARQSGQLTNPSR